MQPLKTIHAGEYLVGSFIESNYKDLRVWIPTKDNGIDLLITDSNKSKTLSLQVKFSKDYLSTSKEKFLQQDIIQQNILSGGWWALNRNKLNNSIADYWIFVLYNNIKNYNIQFIIIKPSELLSRLEKLHGLNKTISCYFWVTKQNNKCWETRGLNKPYLLKIADKSYNIKDRDFSKYLNNWDQIMKHFK